ncbi:MAG: HAMP domain-containing sensor histidine kinase [Mucilaginibacter sp.]|uniref:ATP-binding protein n=1 Tax=Mucilaginibacter sp. TaxID=1882438 RepID=UPI003264E8EF
MSRIKFFLLYHNHLQFKAYFGLFITAAAISFLAACNSKSDTVNKETARQLHIGDSTIIARDYEKGKRLILDARHKIKNTDPALITYYCLRSELNQNSADTVMMFADSAMALFKTDGIKAKYPAQYQQCLITKGSACVRAKKYILALDYYYQAKKATPSGECDNGAVSQRIGDIYYSQRNFVGASEYWSLSYRQLLNCNSMYSAQKIFFEKQARLNNTGFAFHLSGNLDSALYYYKTDLNLINQTEKEHLINKRSIDAARIVCYDNLGGVNLKKGELSIAEDYLLKATSIPIVNIDGMMIPPYIKLAELYLKKGEINKVGKYFALSKQLLEKYAKDNRGLQLRWYKSYAEYLFAVKKPAEAYLVSNKYIALKDSLDNSANKLYRLDVSREFSSITQRQSLLDLQQQDKLKMIYLVGISTVFILLFAIMLLINRNLVRTKKNHAEANLRNQQLQLTLDELERVNKNYIRIMRVMAHDIINPLSGMTGIASMLMIDDDLTEDSRHMLKLIESTGLHSMEMINELLKSGLSNDDEQMKTEVVNLRSLLFDSVELLQFKASSKEQQIIFEFDEAPLMANINHEKMWRVFNNLIVNAIKFSHSGSIINVSIKPKGSDILMAVADSGIGIPDKDKETVFEMFTPAKKAGTNGEQPFGLGLSISKKIVEMHKGKIWFESQPGKGTTFYIQLPAVK